MAEFYRRSKGNAGLDGGQFQVGVSTVFLLNAMRNFKGWRISTENEAAGKFDDIVMEFSDGTAVLLQAKHKNNKRINRDQLLSSNSRNADFSLPKYFLSYQEIKSRFNVKNVIICTSAALDRQKLRDILEPQSASSDSILFYEGGACSYVKFKENILPCLNRHSEMYYDENLQGKGIDKAVITDENLKDFLEKLQLFSGYPSKSKLDKVINNLLANGTDSKLWIGPSSQEIYEKVEDWFKDERGEYLDEALANTMFCEIRSNKFRNTLKDYSVSFTCIDIRFMEGKQIFHVSAERGYLLQVLKVYYALQEKQTLYVNPNDDVEVHKPVLEAFSSSNYEFLVLVLTKNSNQRSVSLINLKLKDKFKTHSYKKIVIICSKEHVQQIPQNDMLELDGTVTWKTLTDQCRERLLSKKTVTFQGVNVSLGELLPTSEVEDYDKAANSEVLESLVKDEKVRVGKRPSGLDQNTARYYVSRKFEREIEETDEDILISGQRRKETLTEADIFEVKGKVILISDSAGMGKTTVLTKLGTDMKEKNPLNWILRIELNDYSRILMDTMRKNKDTITLNELLNYNVATKLTNQLEEYLMSMPQRVVLMLDGFDEISPSYTKLILNLIKQCYTSPSFAKIIVTTRPNVCWALERILQVKPFVLQPFTREDQIAFLTNYWEHHLELDHANMDRCKKYAVALIYKMSSWINPKNNFTGIPLQIRMLAEIFQDNIEWNSPTEWEGCKEFLIRNEKEPMLPERLNLIKLFDMFIDKKFNIFLDKANPKGTAVINSLFTSNFKKYFQNHQCLALKVVLGNETMQHEHISQLFSRFQYDKNVENEMVKIGVVQETNDGIEFIHRTFAEYFAAKSIIDVSQLSNRCLNQDKYFQFVFIDLILGDHSLTVIRSFIESILEDVVEYLSASSLEIYQRFVTGHPESRTYRSHLLHLLANEGCISIMRLILKCICHSITESLVTGDDTDVNHNTLNVLKSLIGKDGINIRDEQGHTPLHYASQRGYFNVVRYLVYDSNTSEGMISVVNDMKLLVNHKVDLNVVGHKGHTALHLAAEEGHFNIVRFLEEQGADINIKNIEDSTALHTPALRGHLQVVKFLRERGVDADMRNDKGYTTLHMASLGGHLDVVKFLVESGADIKITDNKGLTALQGAAVRQKFEVVQFLKGQGLNIDASYENGLTVLHMAVIAGDLSCAKFIVGCGANVNVAENAGISALDIAAELGRLDIVKFLIGSGANVNAIDNTGYSVLHSAAQKGHLDVVKFLVESGGLVEAKDNKEFTILHAAAVSGHLETVKFLIHCGIDVNTVDSHGCTGLYYAAEKGNLNIVKYFVDCGVDFNAPSKLGFAPLYVAAQGGHLDVIQFLVSRGAIVNVTNKEGFTALHAASIMGHLDTVKFFIENKIDVNVCDKDGATPLHSVAGFDHLEIVEYLVKCGADIDKTNHDGCFTVLHMACQAGHLHVIKFLVDNGANIGMRNHDGFTVLHMAAQEGHLDVVKYFIEIGIDVNVLNNYGSTVLHSASLMGHLDIIKFLLQLKVDVNVANKNGRTSLHLAAQHGHLDAAKYLIECGADVNASDDRGYTVLEIASQEGHVKIVSYLLEFRNHINNVY